MSNNHSRLKKVRSFTKDFDIFAHNFKLNFNRKGDTHPTVIGGLISIVLKIIYVLYMIYLLQKMLNHDDDQTFGYDFSFSDSELTQNVSIKDMGVY